MSGQVLDAGKTSVGEVWPLIVDSGGRLLIQLQYYDVVSQNQGQVVTGQQEQASSASTDVTYWTNRTQTTNSAPYLLTKTVTFVASVSNRFTWYSAGGTERILLGLPSWSPREDLILSPSATPISKAFERERQAFLKMRANLLSNPEYSGKFVAVLNKKIVDHDENKVELAKRCYKKHGYVPMFMTKVHRTERVLEMSSPE